MENITDFNFYLKFAKPLILNLPEINDRVLAAAWVKKLKDDTQTEERVRLDYLKLLLFVLQRKKLTSPFTEHPSNLQVLDKFPEDQTLVDVAKKIIEQERAQRQERRNKYVKGPHPPYISDFSADLLEYVAVQNIEDFGVHAYYAISKEPLSTWFRVDKQLLPKAAKSMLEVSQPPATLTETQSAPQIEKTTPKVSLAQEPPPVEQPPAEPSEEPPPEEPAEGTESEPPPAEETPSPAKSPKKKKKSTLGASPPSRPIGRVHPPREDREPPSWGSNLLEAKFLEEEVCDVVVAAEEAAQPMEVLWTSPPHAGAAYDDDYYDMSLPYKTPPIPGARAPPPAPAKKMLKKPPPVPKPTRASLLLQKKKQEALAPPPPKKKQIAKPKAVGQKSSKSDVEEKPSKGAKGKGGKKAVPAIEAGPAPSAEALADDVDEYLRTYNTMIDEIEAQYQGDQRGEPRPGTSQAMEATGAKQKPKRKLSKLAKRSGQKIPKDHDAAVELEQSIHVSEEARAILEEVAERPSSATGRPPSAFRHPQPRLAHDVIVEEPEEETGTDEEDAQAQGSRLVYATNQTGKGQGRKDPRMVFMYNKMLDTSAQMEADELDEFEAMEQIIREETKREREPDEELDEFEALEREMEEEEDAGDKQKRKKLIEEQKMANMRRYHEMKNREYAQMEELEDEGAVVPAEAQQQEEVDEEEGWAPAPDYFAAIDKMYKPLKVQMQSEFPEMEFDEFDELGDDILEDSFGILPEGMVEVESPDRRANTLVDHLILYQDYYKAAPAMGGVPVTSPKPSPVPKRILPPSPPHFPEEFIEIPTSPSQVPPDKYEPHARLDWQSPEREDIQLKETSKVGKEGISPKRKRLFAELEEMHNKLFGTPVKEVPDIFDLPGSPLMGETPPRDWASPVSPEWSPYDPEELKRDVRKHQLPKKRQAYQRTIVTGKTSGGKARIKMHPQPDYLSPLTRRDPWYTRTLVSDVAEQPEPHPGFTWREEEFKEAVTQAQPMAERRDFQMPFKHMPYHPGKLGMKKQPPRQKPILEIEASPEHKVYPEFYDLPITDDMFFESPPRELFQRPPASPGTPEIDLEGLKRAIEEGAITKERMEQLPPRQRQEILRTIRKSKKPGLRSAYEGIEGLGEEEQDQWAKIMTAGRNWEEMKFGARVSKSPELGTITPSPRKMTLARTLKKKKVEYEEGEDEPDESVMEMTEIETDVLDFDSPVGKLIFQKYADTPSEPGTPERGLDEEDMPYVENLVEFSPLSPLSHWQPMADTIAATKERGQKGKFPPKYQKKLRDYYQRRPWRGHEEIPEEPLREDVERIHAEVLEEVDQELAAQRTPPRAEAAQVPFYETPPHLKYSPLKMKELPFSQHDPNRQYLPKRPRREPTHQRPAPTQEEVDEMDEFERMEAEAGNVSYLQAEAVGDETSGDATILEAAADVRDRAQMQYYSLYSPKAEQSPQFKHQGPLPTHATEDDVMAYKQRLKDEEAAQEIEMQEFLEAQEIRRIEEEKAEKKRKAQMEFEYKQKQKALRDAKWVRLSKGGKRAKEGAEEPAAKGKEPAKAVKGKEPAKPAKGKEPAKPAKGKEPAKPAKGKAPVVKGVKSKDSVRSKQSKESVKSKESKESAKSKESKESVKSKESQTKVKKKKKKYDVPSKLDTGRKKKAPPPPPEPAAPTTVEFDRVALQDLGLTQQDLINLNLDDDALIRLQAEPAGDLPFLEDIEAADVLIMDEDMFQPGPSAPKSQVEAQEYYDPETGRMVKALKIRGRLVPLEEGMSPVYEGPKRYADEVIAAADFRLQMEHEDYEAQYGQDVSVMTVEPQMKTPPRSRTPEAPRRRSPGPGMPHLADELPSWEEHPSVLQAVSPAGPLAEAEREAVLEAEAWGTCERLPPDMADFKWMSPTQKGDVYPWE